MAKHPVIHFEIMCKDPDALSAFYKEAFDWSLDASAYPGGGGNGVTKYIVAQPTGEHLPQGYGINGGIGAAPEGYDGHVTFYIRVDDVETALQKVESLGAKRMMGPEQVPNGPTIGLFVDPQGHTVGLVDPQM
jgi:predicted enzyme related to lactoylglutathione lyase